MKRCTACKTDVSARANFVEFDCPSCGEEKIVRCKNCKNLSNKYICTKCEFTGP